MTFEQLKQRIKKDIADLNLPVGEYCIIVYEKGMFSSKAVNSVYRSYEEFVERSPLAFAEIDRMRGIQVQLWKYD